jgi:hypothetical protein
MSNKAVNLTTKVDLKRRSLEEKRGVGVGEAIDSRYISPRLTNRGRTKLYQCVQTFASTQNSAPCSTKRGHMDTKAVNLATKLDLKRRSLEENRGVRVGDALDSHSVSLGLTNRGRTNLYQCVQTFVSTATMENKRSHMGTKAVNLTTKLELKRRSSEESRGAGVGDVLDRHSVSPGLKNRGRTKLYQCCIYGILIYPGVFLPREGLLRFKLQA